MPDRRPVVTDRTLIAVTVVATLALVPWLLRFERTHTDWSPESVDAIAELSAAERSDVKASYERFHNYLSEEKRQRVEALHAAAVADPRRAALIDQYHNWMQELDLTERDRIRSAESVERKVTAIEDLIADEEADDDSFEVDLWNYRTERSMKKEVLEQLRLRFDVPIRISNREFDSMVGDIVSSVPEEGQQQFRTSTHGVSEELPASEQYRLRARALLYALRNTSDWMNETIAEKILNRIEDSQTREKLKSLEPAAKQAVAKTIVYLGVHPFRNLPRYYPNQEQVEQLFTELPREEQIKLMGLSPSGRWSSRHRLNLMYIANKSNAPPDIVDMARGMLSYMDRPRKPGERWGKSGRSRRNGGREAGRPQGSGRPGAPPVRDPDRNRTKERNRP